MKGSGRGVISCTIPAFFERSEENHEILREDGLFAGLVVKPKPPTHEEGLSPRLQSLSCCTSFLLLRTLDHLWNWLRISYHKRCVLGRENKQRFFAVDVVIKVLFYR